jgi:hypothetical protein
MEVPVRAAAMPARAKFGMERLDFGRVTGGEMAEATAILENSGGVTALVELRVDAPFELTATGVQVPARGKVKVPVRYRAPKAGPFGVTVTVLTATSGGVTESLPLSVVVEAPAPVAASEAPRSMPKPTGGEAAAPTSPPTVPGFPAGGVPADVPGKMGQYVRDVTATSAVLEWPATPGTGNALAVYERQLAMGKDRALVTNWLPIKNAKISEGNGVRRAELSDLEPNQLHVVRVVSGGAPVFTTKFMTPEKKSIFDFGWRNVFVTLMVVGLGVVMWYRWKNRVKSGW